MTDTFRVQVPAETLSVLTTYHQHLTSRHLSSGTVRAYRSILSGFAIWLGLVTVLDAEKRHVVGWLDSRHLDARARYTYLSTLHGFYGLCTRSDF